MNQEARKEILKKLLHLAGFSHFADALHSDEFEDLCEQIIQQEDWAEKFSWTYIDDAVTHILTQLNVDKSTERAEQYLDELTSQLSLYSDEQIVHIPLFGIRMDEESLHLGKIVLKQMNASQVADLAAKFEAAVPRKFKAPENNKVVTQFLRESIVKLSGTVCAEYRLDAEPEKARERAIDETQSALDLLRYALPAMYSDELRVAIGIQGDFVPSVRSIPIVSSDGKGFHYYWAGTGSLMNFELTESKIQDMVELGVFEASDILAKNDKNRNEFERALLAGIHWFANAQKEREARNKLLSLVICLETFLTPTEREPVTNAIAEGVALVVGTEIVSRKYIKSRIRHFYGLRSAISHGGHKQITYADVTELRELTGSVIKILLGRRTEFQTKQALLDWIEEKKLT